MSSHQTGYQAGYHPAFAATSPQVEQPSWSRAAHIARVKAAMLRSAETILDAEGFTQVVPPMLTTMSGACGDPGTLIPVELGRDSERAYLRQTAQLYLEPLMRELGRVYSISRSFRAERHIDSRHLPEFTLVEAEALGWTLPQLMELMERLVVNMLQHAATATSRHLIALGAVLTGHTSLKAPFARMTYDDAIISLQKQGHFIEWGEELGNTHELALTELAGGPLFIMHYPVASRFFTMKVCRQDPRVVECCDLLLPGVGEVMGASETERDPDLLESKLMRSPSVLQWIDLGSSAADYNWYIAMHHESSPQQAGFGMGFERIVRYACALRDIGEAA